MKRWLALVGIMVVGAAVASCACPGILCVSKMSFVVHIARDRSGLEGSTVTVCQAGHCMGGTPAWIDRSDPRLPTGGWENANIAFMGAIGGEGSIQVTPDGRATLDVTAWPRNVRDGDLYAVRVVDASGTALIDFSRKLDYGQGRGGTCGPTCYSGAVEVWPSSTNGLTCTSLARLSGATYVTPALALPDDQAQGTTFDVCRNMVCSRAIWPRNVFDGALGASLAGGISGDGNAFVFEIEMDDDPAVLADGDTYTVTVTDAHRNVVAAVDQAATYQQTFPDGSACDAFPTRRLTLAP
jgi:hypothetical protein